jgi:hypothetical protein
MTFDGLLLTMVKLKMAMANGKKILRPVTKEQSDIFKAFDIRLPNCNTFKVTVPKKRGRKPNAVTTTG